MSDYRRYFVPGATYFFTVVTANRRPWFAEEAARSLLGDVMRQCFATLPVETVAIVLLPDHLHTLWALPQGDSRYSLRWRKIKREFTRRWLMEERGEQPVSLASVRERRRGIWQRRFWEHTIRDEADLETHFDYIHFNPVKHQQVKRPRDWPWSSFHRWVALGHYPLDWGAGIEPPSLPDDQGE